MKIKLILFAALTTTAFAQGPLTPPGAPAPTMKTLDQLDQKLTQIDAKLGQVFRITSLPATIGFSGSYVVDADLGGTGGITIAASDVTLDLQGHIITGAGAGAGQTGISTSSALSNVTIRNGTIADWSQSGIDLSNTAGVRLERLRVVRNGDSGAAVGNGAHVRDSLFASNTGLGLFAGTAARIADCVARANGLEGFRTSFGAAVSGCTAEGNAAAGFSVHNNSTIVDCASLGGAVGVSLGVGTVMERSAVYGSGSFGVFVASGAIIRGCNIESNGAGMMIVVQGGTVVNCSVDHPAAIAISVLGTGSVIDGNRVNGNIVVDVSSVRAKVVRNFAGSISDAGTDSKIAPIGDLNAASTNPWANFLF